MFKLVDGKSKCNANLDTVRDCIINQCLAFLRNPTRVSTLNRNGLHSYNTDTNYIAASTKYETTTMDQAVDQLFNKIGREFISRRISGGGSKKQQQQSGDAIFENMLMEGFANEQRIPIKRKREPEDDQQQQPEAKQIKIDNEEIGQMIDDRMSKITEQMDHKFEQFLSKLSTPPPPPPQSSSLPSPPEPTPIVVEQQPMDTTTTPKQIPIEASNTYNNTITIEDMKQKVVNSLFDSVKDLFTQ